MLECTCRGYFIVTFTLLLLLAYLGVDPCDAAVPVTLHGLNYNTRKGPDWDPEKCKEWHEVLNDLTLQSRLTKRFRLLSMTDCGQAAMVLEVAKILDLQLWLGLWVGPPPEDSNERAAFDKDFSELERLIDEEPDLIKNHVLGISVGSEALYRKDADLQDMLMNFFSGTYTCMDYVAWIDACALDSECACSPASVLIPYKSRNCWRGLVLICP
jgi:hypothetical protein